MYNNQLGYHLKKAQHLLHLTTEEELAQVGVSLPQYAVLTILTAEPSITNAELARKAFVTAQTMHKIIKGLDRRGLLVRKQQEPNKKAFYLTLTVAGKQCVKQADAILRKIDNDIQKALGTQGYEETLVQLKDIEECLSRREN